MQRGGTRFGPAVFFVNMALKTIYTSICASPCGNLVLGSHEGKLCFCVWENTERAAKIIGRVSYLLGAETTNKTDNVATQAIMQLESYFANELKDFSIPLLLIGTPFQKTVWAKLCQIPYGSTVSYLQIAQKMGSPKAVRAVANAVGANTLNIFIPCHRIIGSNGQLTGYGGGLEAKKILLEIESKNRKMK